jgi:hypothetical protein
VPGVVARLGVSARAHRRAALWTAFYAALAVGVAVAVRQAFAQLPREATADALGWLSAALVALLVQLVLLTLVWQVLLRAALPDSRIPRSLMLRSFALGSLGRYLPGVADLAGTYVVCRRDGVTPGGVRAAIVHQRLLQLAALPALPALTAGFLLDRHVSGIAVLGVVAAMSLVAVAALRRAIRQLLRPVNRLLGTVDERSLLAPGRRPLVVAASLLLAAGVAGGLALHLVAVALTPWPASRLGAGLLAYGVATLAGYLIPLLPAGGVAREVALASRAVAVLVDASYGAGLLGAMSSPVARARRAAARGIASSRAKWVTGTAPAVDGRSGSSRARRRRATRPCTRRHRWCC